ncbi:hypothetical protein [Mycolicibacterium pallens]|uniref:PPE family protein n=1 Tax=Mycolicibacterium pallens TaxID=370524 RepID=A0ABX8VHZ0_9MYCO|nr:hypothetical protein [Mycolicibacterium pallens]QYL17430.1 hypothetical protein K0O64_02295 [Mycolicibacterium pallens]
MTVAACGMAPTANATCASFFGFNHGGGCASSPTSIAIAVGAGAQAYAEGVLGAAFAIGTNSIASVPSTGTNFLNMATALGVDTLAEAGGAVTGALAAGQSVSALASIGLPSYLPVANFAINLSLSPTNNVSVAEGVGNLSVNLFGSGAGQDVRAIGLGNVAINVGGTSNAVRASVGTSNRSYASFAFNVGGSGNLVQAGAGPLAIAGAFNQFGATVTQFAPGINLFTRLALAAAAQGLKIPTAAASHGTVKTVPATHSGSATHPKTVAHAAGVSHRR